MPNQYRNPVLPGFYPDPSVCRVGRDYYLVTSSFEYFPGVPIFHSTDLVNWEQVGHCLTRPSQLPLEGAPASGGIFAPTLRHHGGVFYMTTTNTSFGGNFIVTAPAPEGPWSEPIAVAQPGIDPSLFFDEDGSVFYTTSHDGAFQKSHRRADRQALVRTSRGWAGTGGQYPEGPHLYFRDGWYYLLLSEGGTEYGHMITMARSRALGDRSSRARVTRCSLTGVIGARFRRWGTPILVEALDGTWHALFLGARPNGYPPCYHLGRETFLCPVAWADDGFPVVRRPGPRGARDGDGAAARARGEGGSARPLRRGEPRAPLEFPPESPPRALLTRRAPEVTSVCAARLTDWTTWRHPRGWGGGNVTRAAALRPASSSRRRPRAKRQASWCG